MSLPRLTQGGPSRPQQPDLFHSTLTTSARHPQALGYPDSTPTETKRWGCYQASPFPYNNKIPLIIYG